MQKSHKRQKPFAELDAVMAIFNEALERHGTRLEGDTLVIRFTQEELDGINAFFA